MFGLKKMQRDILAQGIMLSQMKNDETLERIKSQVFQIEGQLNAITKMLGQVLVNQETDKPKAKAPVKPRGRPRKKTE